jgi:hypothetical protein
MNAVLRLLRYLGFVEEPGQARQRMGFLTAFAVGFAIIGGLAFLDGELVEGAVLAVIAAMIVGLRSLRARTP